ncbi:MAG TPA: TetR/AcrR family transcriptional regulator [Actinomycetota bacterium]
MSDQVAEVSPPPPRSPGRPRSPTAERAILDATLELLASEGFDRLTVEGVAAQAGVGKATIYRRWPSKLALVLAAVGELSTHPLPELTTGRTRDDLVSLLRHIIEALSGTIAGRILPGLVAESARSPDLLGVLHDFWITRRKIMMKVLRQGAAQGDLPEGVDLELIADLLYGPVHYRFLISAAPLDRPLAEQVVDAVMAQWGPVRKRSGKRRPRASATGKRARPAKPQGQGKKPASPAVRRSRGR